MWAVALDTPARRLTCRLADILYRKKIGESGLLCQLPALEDQHARRATEKLARDAQSGGTTANDDEIRVNGRARTQRAKIINLQSGFPPGPRSYYSAALSHRPFPRHAGRI
jgi:hypothetical protein